MSSPTAASGTCQMLEFEIDRARQSNLTANMEFRSLGVLESVKNGKSLKVERQLLEVGTGTCPKYTLTF
jgi:hypothetical protein